MTSTSFNDSTTTLSLLHSRRSGKARDMVAPGPTDAELTHILAAALRVPDHGKLAPWRYVIIEDRARFAETLQGLYRAQKPEAGRLEMDAVAAAAHQAPLLLAALSKPRPESHIPLWEQQLSMGASIMALIVAAHALGYAANWLSGPMPDLPGLPDALGEPGARLAGFIHIGTPAKPLDERPRPAMADIVKRF